MEATYILAGGMWPSALIEFKGREVMISSASTKASIYETLGAVYVGEELGEELIMPADQAAGRRHPIPVEGYTTDPNVVAVYAQLLEDMAGDGEAFMAKLSRGPR